MRKFKVCWIIFLTATYFTCLPQAWGQGLLGPKKTAKLRVQYLKAVEKEVLRLTNAERRKRHLSSLDADDDLTATARAHSDDMLKRDFFSHVNPDGKSPAERLMPSHSMPVAKVGENIWKGSRLDTSDAKLLARLMVDGWLTSPGHRANILNQDYTHLGVGISLADNQIRATQLFATVKSRK
jgi:uncharacterized protein YkwD